MMTALRELEQGNIQQMNLGQHVLAEFFECDPNILNSISSVEKHMIDAALECGATIVQKCFHMFNPYGVSGVVIISESHLAIHTWPELGYAAVDYTELKRGIIDSETMKLSNQRFQLAQQI